MQLQLLYFVPPYWKGKTKAQSLSNFSGGQVASVSFYVFLRSTKWNASLILLRDCEDCWFLEVASQLGKSFKVSVYTMAFIRSRMHSHHGTSEAPRHLLFENSTWQLEVGRPRKNDRDRRVHVWPQTQVQLRAGRSRHVGFRYGRERYWKSSGIPCTEQDKGNLGYWTSTEVRRAWNNNNL